MKLEFFFIGKTSDAFVENGIKIYSDRLGHYMPFLITLFPSFSLDKNKKFVNPKEADGVLKKINKKDFVILLDEEGKQFTSVQLADYISNVMNRGVSKIIFICGGAFGLPEDVVKRADLILSFSKFTFTHQMIRVLLLEQIYRAMTIIKNESYHHG